MLDSTGPKMMLIIASSSMKSVVWVRVKKMIMSLEVEVFIQLIVPDMMTDMGIIKRHKFESVWSIRSFHIVILRFHSSESHSEINTLHRLGESE